ncbi:AAA family ATPase [Marinivivus vitaminiproducens]|uniref:AAA family ATPase n=1 Tax=Marinivivus vitaminiproducens TaxID=3035935 RepID=UPI0027A10705|nr:AAA family ATPase [Geminicoccaceae bacterium SCSIO 64248]
MTGYAERFEWYASVCHSVQQRAIELENQPDKRKGLRMFAPKEVAAILGISPGHLRNLHREPNFPPGRSAGNGRRSYSIDDLHAARAWLFDQTNSARYDPSRRENEGEKLQTIAFVNFKGGSGKTTSATHFAQYLALHGYRVLLIDLDPQASATALFGLHPDTDVAPEATFAGWTRRDDDADAASLAKRMPQTTYWPRLDLIPASLALQQVEYELVGTLLAQRRYPFYDQLRQLLAHVSERYDVVVCDCRPDVGMLTLNALIAATGLVVPMPPSMIDFASSGEFFRILAQIARDLTEVAPGALAYDFVRVLITKHKMADRNQEAIVAWQRAHFGGSALDAPMLETALVDAAGILKETLYEYEPEGNRQTYQRGLTAMNRVNASLEAELLRVWGRSATGQGLAA